LVVEEEEDLFMVEEEAQEVFITKQDIQYRLLQVLIRLLLGLERLIKMQIQQHQAKVRLVIMVVIHKFLE